MVPFAVEQTVASANHTASGTKGLTIGKGREAERRTTTGGIRLKVEEAILRIKEPGLVVVIAEVELRTNARTIAAGDVVTHEVDNDPEAMGMNTRNQGGKLIKPLGGLQGVIGTDIKEIGDGKGTAGESLEQIGIVGRQASLGVTGRRCVAEDSEQPKMSEPHLAQGTEGNVVMSANLPTPLISAEP